LRFYPRWAVHRRKSNCRALKQRADRTVASKAERIKVNDAIDMEKHIWDS